MNSNNLKKKAIDRLIFGLFILLFGTVWLLRQAGIIPEPAWLWPFAFMYFGTIILVSAVYRLRR